MSFIYINFKATFFRIIEMLRVIFKYYRYPGFIFFDLALLSQYLFKNPHRISKNFLKKREEKNIFAYGETPLTTLDKICRECRLLSKDVVFDLGCGTGRTSFWLRKFVKCKVIAVDYLPVFIKRANRVKNLFSESKIAFLEKDMLLMDFREATAVYLYGTCLEDEIITKLIEKFRSLRAGSKVITVSYPLTDYDDKLFKVEKVFTVRFPWGKSEVFLNLRTNQL